MGFIMDGLDAEAYDRKYSDAVLVRRILTYFTAQGPRMAAVAAAIFGVSLLDISLPIVISRGLDDLKPGQVDSALGLAVLVITLGGCSWLLNFVRRSFSAQAVANV